MYGHSTENTYDLTLGVASFRYAGLKARLQPCHKKEQK
jgi:hypothetical protein